MSGSSTLESAMETCSTVESSVENVSRKSETGTYSDRNQSTGSDASELAIHTLLVETRGRDLDRELHRDPDSDCYLFLCESVFDNTADDLEMKALSKRSMSL